METMLVLLGIVVALSIIVYLAFVKLPRMGRDKSQWGTSAISLGCTSCSNRECRTCELTPVKVVAEVMLPDSSGSRDLNLLDSEEVKLR